ncbi:MAG: hypothetical protein JXR37_16145 [Kiritimatiellae bacterium]|nr:hypothetical protein [Kiritimatiellia bacterium]
MGGAVEKDAFDISVNVDCTRPYDNPVRDAFDASEVGRAGKTVPQSVEPGRSDAVEGGGGSAPGK